MKNNNFYPMLCELMNTSARWISVTTNENNKDKTVSEIAHEYNFKLEKLDQSNPMNPALLMASAYVFFVYPKENATDFSNIVTSQFVVREGSDKNICRRLRNSLAHGNFKFLKGEIIEFTDHNKGKNFIRFDIPMNKFGHFLNSCLSNIY